MHYTSPSARLRLEQVRQFLDQQDASRPLLVIGASWGVADELVRLCPRPSFGWHRLSWDQLLWRLCPQAEPLSSVAAWGCLQRALQQSPPAAFAAISGYPGFALAVQRTLSECRQAQVAAGPDLEELAATYEAVLNEEGLLDHPLTQALRSVLEADWLSPFQAVVGIDLDLSLSTRRLLWDRLSQRIPNSLLVQPGPGPDHDALAPVRANLFASQLCTGPSGCVQVVSASQPLAECRELVREMLEQARRGVCWQDMAVFMARSEGYLEALQTTLQRAQIPAYFSQGLRRPDPQGRAFLTLLECARERLSARRFSEYLGLVEMGGAARRWQELLQEASVIEGLDRWQRCLPALAQLRQRQINQLQREEPEHPRLPRYAEDIEALGSLRQFAQPLLACLVDLGGQRNWGEWVEKLEPLARRWLPQPQAVLDLLEQLGPLRRVGPVDLNTVVQTLGHPLVELREPSSGHRYGRVFVAPLREAGGRSFRVVFLPGLAERRFPSPPREDPLLSDQARRLLSPDLLTSSSRSQLEREALQLAVGASQELLVVSFPQRESERNRPLLPSVYLLELVRADQGKLLTPQQIMEQCSRPSLPHPTRALDQVEEGLAWLHRPAQLGERRFLVERNLWLRRSLRNAAQRLQPHWTRADGYVGPSLRALAPAGRAYSASALQRFAACPYQFFLYAAYRLDLRQQAEPLEELDALTRGTLLHELHARLVWQPQVRLEQELEKLSQEWSEHQLILLPQAYADEVEQLGREFSQWLRNRPADWVAAHAELAFQMVDDLGRDPASRKEPAQLGEGFLLRGSVDRVERNAAGQLRVIDLKSGLPSWGPLHIGGGKLLQPALYALAVAHELQAEVVESSLEFCTRKGEFKSRCAKPLQQAQETALAALHKLDETMKAGYLPAKPAHRACEYCNYLKVCGPHAATLASGKASSPCTEAIDWWREQL